MLLVGLTGGIACGKSTVSSLLAERHGLPIIDADEIAKAVVQQVSWGDTVFNGWRTVAVHTIGLPLMPVAQRPGLAHR